MPHQLSGKKFSQICSTSSRYLKPPRPVAILAITTSSKPPQRTCPASDLTGSWNFASVPDLSQSAMNIRLRSLWGCPWEVS